MSDIRRSQPRPSGPRFVSQARSQLALGYRARLARRSPARRTPGQNQYGAGRCDLRHDQSLSDCGPTGLAVTGPRPS